MEIYEAWVEAPEKDYTKVYSTCSTAHMVLGNLIMVLPCF